MNEKEMEKAKFEHSPYQFHGLSQEEGMFCVDILNMCYDFNNLEAEKQKCKIVMIDIEKQEQNSTESVYTYSGAYNINSTGENRTFRGTMFLKEQKIEVVNLIERLCVDVLEDTPKRYRTFDTFKHIEDNLYERKSSYNYTEKEIEPKKVCINKFEVKTMK